MQARYAGQLKLDVEYHNMPGHTCESCGWRNAKWRVGYNPPGKTAVEHELCDDCAPTKP